MLDKKINLWYNIGTKIRNGGLKMLNWELAEHYEELADIIHEMLEQEAE